MKITGKQWSNLAKFLYDTAKLTFGGLIVTNTVSKEPLNLGAVIIGSIITTIQVGVAFYLDSKGGQND